MLQLLVKSVEEKDNLQCPTTFSVGSVGIQTFPCTGNELKVAHTNVHGRVPCLS